MQASTDSTENFDLEDSLNAEMIVYGTQPENSTFVPGVAIYVQASDMQDKSLLNFAYTIDEFSESNLIYSLKFENPVAVSATTEKDSLVV